ncbi:MAG: hypothetical protein ACK4I8_05995 [Armatimonadota bacterium]
MENRRNGEWEKRRRKEQSGHIATCMFTKWRWMGRCAYRRKLVETF